MEKTVLLENTILCKNGYLIPKNEKFKEHIALLKKI